MAKLKAIALGLGADLRLLGPDLGGDGLAGYSSECLEYLHRFHRRWRGRGLFDPYFGEIRRRMYRVPRRSPACDAARLKNLGPQHSRRRLHYDRGFCGLQRLGDARGDELWMADGLRDLGGVFSFFAVVTGIDLVEVETRLILFSNAAIFPLFFSVQTLNF